MIIFLMMTCLLHKYVRRNHTLQLKFRSQIIIELIGIKNCIAAKITTFSSKTLSSLLSPKKKNIKT